MLKIPDIFSCHIFLSTEITWFYELHMSLLRAGIAQAVYRLAYGLDDLEVGVRVQDGREFSFLHVVQTGSGAHPATYPMGIGGSFTGAIVAGA
jgi:hypothetical protein